MNIKKPTAEEENEMAGYRSHFQVKVPPKPVYHPPVVAGQFDDDDDDGSNIARFVFVAI